MRQETITAAVRECVAVPPHIDACASAVRYDLLHGPAWAAVPPAGIEAFTADHFATFREDLEDLEAEGCAVSEVYAGPVAQALRDFIDDLPTLYVDEVGFASEYEPQGYWDEDPEDLDNEMSWVDPEPYYEVSGADLVSALFGPTIAREFR